MGANQSHTTYDTVYPGEDTIVKVPRNLSGRRRERYIRKEVKRDHKKFTTG